MQDNNIKIGLFGFGCVGQGLFEVLNNSPGFKAEILRIVVKDRNKVRTLPEEYFEFEADKILQDPDINTVVELIDDPWESYRIAKQAMQSGKNFITANKRMLAYHLPELAKIADQHKVSFLYEGAAGGSIPIIRNLEEYYDNELLNSTRSIINGSCNYILTRMEKGKMSFEASLQEAQRNGFAESDPSLDIDGWDSLFKTVILAKHSFGMYVEPINIPFYGIRNISEEDLEYAALKNYRIKLVSDIRKVENGSFTSFVLPTFLNNSDELYFVEHEYNGILVEAAFSDIQFLKGKGAGGHPTGSAVLSDIAACRYGYKYEYKKQLQRSAYAFSPANLIRVYISWPHERKFPKDLPLEIIDSGSLIRKNYLEGKLNLLNWPDIRNKLENIEAFIAVLPTVYFAKHRIAPELDVLPG